MSDAPLSPLRMDLDFMPSPVEDRPGLLIRDPMHYSDATMIVPPPLIQCLALFDGEHTALDLRQALVQITGDLQVSDLADQLCQALSAAGFLHDDSFEQMRETLHQAFRDQPVREAAHAGSGYPDNPDQLRMVMNQYLGQHRATRDGLLAIAAPHVSPFGGWESYRDAYCRLAPSDQDRIFVVLGTSHYGAPDKFGLTRKPFVTPYGQARTETALVDELAARAPNAVTMEDFCHATEHSIEFQIVFLQALYGANIRILPILCGSYARSIYEGGMPEDNEDVRRFLEALGELHAREAKKLLWVLGVDMAHMGARYQDRFEARANEGPMQEVAQLDNARIDCLTKGDAPGFWNLVQQNQDDLKWCGSSPFYTFLKAVPQARGRLERYQQWNIDEQSVVSFAGLTFGDGAPPDEPSRIILAS